MTDMWMKGFSAWCLAVVVFGLVLLSAASPTTERLILPLLDLMNGRAPAALDDVGRFAFALLGSVTIGWGLTVFGLVRAAAALGLNGRTAWGWLVISISLWFVIDSAFSIALGFALNAVSNSLFFGAFLLLVFGSGVLRASDQTHAPLRPSFE